MAHGTVWQVESYEEVEVGIDWDSPPLTLGRFSAGGPKQGNLISRRGLIPLFPGQVFDFVGVYRQGLYTHILTIIMITPVTSTIHKESTVYAAAVVGHSTPRSVFVW